LIDGIGNSRVGKSKNKRFCILQVTPSEPNAVHCKLFEDREQSDLYFVTYEKENQKSLKFCPGTVWSETRNIMAELVPKKYDYYMFLDHDLVLEPRFNLDPYEQILEDLELNPAVLTYYPGTGIDSPLVQDQNFLTSRDYSCIPFTHNGIKIVHKSLMKWFFPLYTKYRTDTDACHMFNIQEIPFLRNVVCSHKMVHHNTPNDSTADQIYNSDGAYTTYKMNQMFKDILPAFKKRGLLQIKDVDYNLNYNSLSIKEFFVSLFRQKNFEVIKNSYDVDYYDEQKISKFFDLNHDQFLNCNLSLAEKFKPISKESIEVVKSCLRELKFDDFVTPLDPWPGIVKDVNERLSDKKISINECLRIYQNLEDNESVFHRNSVMDSDLEKFLKDKTVALVGPSPYLRGQGRGQEIDSCDVVVRIQHNIYSEQDFGKRSDIIQSCLNPNYGNPLVSHIKSLSPKDRPKFIICNDSVSAPNNNEVAVGGLEWKKGWFFTDEVYGNIFQELNIPLVNLKRSDGTWDRWGLYWQVYAKQHLERFSTGNYTTFTANFNSGYGSINFLLRYSLKELRVYGMDFYNTGLPQTNEEKYNSEYIKTYGSEGTPLGPDKLLHDQVSQMMHCKNVLMRDPRLFFDPIVVEKLNSKTVCDRINRFSNLPKFKKDTR